MKTTSDFLTELSDFLYPRSQYYGESKTEYLQFNLQLQEFSQRVNYICNLQTGGKIAPDEAYKQIHHLWKHLKRSKKAILLD